MRSTTWAPAVCLFLALFFTSMSHAQNAVEEGGRRFRFLLGVGGTYGGEKLVDYTYTIITPGMPYTSEGTSDVKSGSGAQVFFGGSYNFDSIPFEFELALGWMVNRSKRIDDKETTFERYTVEGLLLYRNDVLRMGGGLVNHLNPTLNEDVISGESFKFDTARGYCFDIGFEGKYVAVSIRRTIIEYVFEGLPQKVSGKNYGLYITVSI